MKILVVGTGARENVICESLKDHAELYSIMSNKNPGISRISEYKIADENDLETVKQFAINNNVEMAIIGPESPLEKGIVDYLENAGINCVGPTQSAARIETDKSFMRKLFEDYKIEGSLVYKVFDDYSDASKFIDEFEKDVVIKPVGLTGGKGVKIVGEHLKDTNEAKKYAKEVIDNKMGGFAKVVIEEKLIGEEFTLQAFSDGNNLVPMPAVQDHPHAFEGDKGPITGGMGSYSDRGGLLPFLTKKDYDRAVNIMKNTISAIKKETGPYKGFLYGQFMLCADGPRLIEYNARFGDPEAMNVLPLIETNFIEICENIVDGTLKKAKFKDKATVCKYLVPNGYPEHGKAGQALDVKEEQIRNKGALLYYAAVNQKDHKIFTSSSRALALVGIGDSIAEAEKTCESVMGYVEGDLFHRRDVGTAALIQKRIDHINKLKNNLHN
ncbi:MAG: phosphoribosylamine--glycine ligase [Methanobacteriaceae archaeon]|nr:phosphoribosylamine--glycine ligase [Methanobacteriaceae archaeon]